MATNPYLYSQYQGPGVGFGPGPDIVKRPLTPGAVGVGAPNTGANSGSPTYGVGSASGGGAPASTTGMTAQTPTPGYVGPPDTYTQGLQSTPYGVASGAATGTHLTLGGAAAASAGQPGPGNPFTANIAPPGTPGTPGTPGAITQQQQLMAALSQGPGSTPGTGTSGLPPAITPGTGTPTNAPGTAVASSYQDPNQKKPFGTPGSPIRFF